MTIQAQIDVLEDEYEEILTTCGDSDYRLIRLSETIEDLEDLL